MRGNSRFLILVASISVLSCSKAAKEQVTSVPALRDITVNVISTASYDYLSSGTVWYETDAGDKGRSVTDGKSFTASVSAETGAVLVAAGTESPVFAVPSVQKKFYQSASEDFSSGMTAFGEAAAGAVDASVTLTPHSAGIRIKMFDSKHYADNEVICIISFSSDGDKPVTGTQLYAFGTGLGPVSMPGTTVSVVWSNEDPGQKIFVGPVREEASEAGMIILPQDGISGTFEVVTDRNTYRFSRDGISVAAGEILDVELDFSSPDEQPVRKVGILGDSISTFAGWIDSSYSAFYPANDSVEKGGTGTVQNVENTWWYRLVYDNMQYGEIDVVNSYSGTKVVTEGGVRGFVDRAYAFNDPDIILIHGGTNDMNQLSPVGDYDWNVPIGQLDDKCYRSAYIKLIKKLYLRFPGVQLVIIVGDRLSKYEYDGSNSYPYATSTIEIAKHFGIPYVDFTENGTTYDTLPKSTGSHPDSDGMKMMADRIFAACTDYLP